MFGGQTLAGWRETAFAGHGEVHCQTGVVVLNMGDPFTGINWTNEFPKVNYEVAFDAMRVMGSDFFCGLTVPVGTNFCSLIVGGWGGSLVGISSLGWHGRIGERDYEVQELRVWSLVSDSAAGDGEEDPGVD